MTHSAGRDEASGWLGKLSILPPGLFFSEGEWSFYFQLFYATPRIILYQWNTSSVIESPLIVVDMKHWNRICIWLSMNNSVSLFCMNYIRTQCESFKNLQFDVLRTLIFCDRICICLNIKILTSNFAKNMLINNSITSCSFDKFFHLFQIDDRGLACGRYGRMCGVFADLSE